MRVPLSRIRELKLKLMPVRLQPLAFQTKFVGNLARPHDNLSRPSERIYTGKNRHVHAPSGQFLFEIHKY